MAAKVRGSLEATFLANLKNMLEVSVRKDGQYDDGDKQGTSTPYIPGVDNQNQQLSVISIGFQCALVSYHQFLSGSPETRLILVNICFQHEYYTLRK
jgi:hypothetical protein